ncbi:YcaO-like family protein [Sorangium sp. So ce388]|uniref:YcaO-like family protein n=1 Tax=Sorangium sp. So ce388 TaxID=3133309 RepID=UPI003F5C366A
MIAADGFTSTPAVSPAGHARSFDDTEAWVRPLLRRVPITRVVDVTPLDYLELPSWVAVTPLAKDLTTHAGKGLTHRAARLSAIMEAIERCCAEDLPASTEVRRASFEEQRESTGDAVLNLDDCDLPFRSVYRPDRACSWMMAFDLIQRQRVWVPVDLVITPGSDGIYPGPHTNGLASGNTYTEAALHALCEVIERDTVAQHEFCDEVAEPDDHGVPQCRMIDLDTIPGEFQEWRDRITRAGLRLAVGELINSTAVSTFAAGILDPAFPSLHGAAERRFAGWGTDLDPQRAVLRAVTEAVQSRVVTMQGARDTFEGGQSIDRTWTLQRLADFYYPRESHPFDAARSSSSGDLLRDLEEVCERLASAGFTRCIVADLTRSDLQVPVVRIIVPGMSGPNSCGERPSWRQLRHLL